MPVRIGSWDLASGCRRIRGGESIKAQRAVAGLNKTTQPVQNKELGRISVFTDTRTTLKSGSVQFGFPSLAPELLTQPYRSEI
ncbi:MAG: hypothetical protein ABSH32_34220 [Bryobacteraceae bacterium]|jgi:hypothetical protein